MYVLVLVSTARLGIGSSNHLLFIAVETAEIAYIEPQLPVFSSSY